MDRVQPLKIYMKVAELQSFTKAAEALGLPKASVSAQVQQLENEIGTRLLNRTTRTVQLTPDGMAFYDRCKDVLADLGELESMFQNDPAGLTGKIRVDMPSRFARFIILPRLQEFLDAHPGIQIEIGSTDRFVDVVREGYDCVIRAGNLKDSSLIAKRLGELRMVNCASRSYLKKYGTPKSLADLKDHFLVHYVSNFGGKPDGFEYRDGDTYRSIAMKGRVTVNNAEAYAAACVNGLGIIQAPRHTLSAHFMEKTLIEILPTHQAESMPLNLVYPHQRNLPRRVRVFMDWIEECFKKP